MMDTLSKSIAALAHNQRLIFDALQVIIESGESRELVPLSNYTIVQKRKELDEIIDTLENEPAEND